MTSLVPCCRGGGSSAERAGRWPIRGGGWCEMDVSRARELLEAGDPYCCLSCVRDTRGCSLSHAWVGRGGGIQGAVRIYMDSNLRKYSDRLGGYVLAYDDVRIGEREAVIVDDIPYVKLTIDANYIVFKPNVGSTLKGTVNKVGRDYLSCLVHGCFNVSILRRGGGGGASVAIKEEEGEESVWNESIRVGTVILLTVTALHPHGKVMHIRGKFIQIDESWQEEEWKKEAEQKAAEEKQKDAGEEEDDGYDSAIPKATRATKSKSKKGVKKEEEEEKEEEHHREKKKKTRKKETEVKEEPVDDPRASCSEWNPPPPKEKRRKRKQEAIHDEPEIKRIKVEMDEEKVEENASRSKKKKKEKGVKVEPVTSEEEEEEVEEKHSRSKKKAKEKDTKSKKRSKE